MKSQRELAWFEPRQVVFTVESTRTKVLLVQLTCLPVLTTGVSHVRQVHLALPVRATV